jgi:hypothetical protein
MWRKWGENATGFNIFPAIIFLPPIEHGRSQTVKTGYA